MYQRNFTGAFSQTRLDGRLTARRLTLTKSTNLRIMPCKFGRYFAGGIGGTVIDYQHFDSLGNLGNYVENLMDRRGEGRLGVFYGQQLFRAALGKIMVEMLARAAERLL